MWINGDKHKWHLVSLFPKPEQDQGQYREQRENSFSLFFSSYKLFYVASAVDKTKGTCRASEGKRTHLLLAMLPEGQPFISGDGYMGAAWGCCIMGFWAGPILDVIMGLGGLGTLLYAGSGCWLSP